MDSSNSRKAFKADIKPGISPLIVLGAAVILVILLIITSGRKELDRFAFRYIGISPSKNNAAFMKSPDKADGDRICVVEIKQLSGSDFKVLGIRVSRKFSAEYDFNDNIEKFKTESRTAIQSLVNEKIMAAYDIYDQEFEVESRYPHFKGSYSVTYAGGVITVIIMIAVLMVAVPVIISVVIRNIAKKCSLTLSEDRISGKRKRLFSEASLDLPIGKLDSIMVTYGIGDKLTGGTTVAIRSASDKIRELKAMAEEGLISQEEFDEKRKEILSKI